MIGVSIGALLVAGVMAWWLAGAGHESKETSPAFSLSSGSVAAQGRALYQTYCASCHGVRGEGQPGWQRQNPDGIYPAPPHDVSGHTWHHGDGTLYRIVKDGGATFQQAGFRSSMPPFEGQLDQAEIRAVIGYLKTLWGGQERAYQAQQSRRDSFP